MANQPDIFETLTSDHARQRELLERITQAEPGSDEQGALFEAFTIDSKGHAAAEEQALYSTVLRKPPLTACGRHSVAEHHEIEGLLNDAAAAEVGSSEWEEKFAALKHRYLHHIDEEEEEMFPRFAEVLTDDDAVYMRQVFERRKVVETEKAEVTPERLEDKDD